VFDSALLASEDIRANFLQFPMTIETLTIVGWMGIVADSADSESSAVGAEA
jgi:hypothetical protein